MVAKAERAARRKAKSGRHEPLKVNMTLRFRFGDQPEDQVTVMDGREVPMVGSVFRYRDKILRGFARLLVNSGLKTPRVVRELMPAMKLWRK